MPAKTSPKRPHTSLPVVSRKSDALFVKATVFGIDVECLVDTGSTATILHADKYLEIPESVRPELHPPSSTLRMADGNLVTPLGTANFPLVIDNKEYEQPVIVANIDEQFVLGFDFLAKYKCTIDAASRSLQIGQIPIQNKESLRSASTCRIRVSENIVLPPYSETVIKGDIVGETTMTECVLEPCSEKLAQKGVVIARSLVDIKQKSVPLRVGNFTNETVTVHKGTFAAVGEEIHHIETRDLKSESVCQIDQRATEVSDLNSNIPEHLADLLVSSDSVLNEEQKLKFKNLLLRHKDVFAKSKCDLGVTNIVQHQINTGDSAPIKQAPRRLPILKRETVKDEIDKMLQNGIIEPSTSPWASPIVLVTKKDGSVRFCIDYRRLNAVTHKDSYPLPRIDDSLDALRGSKWFSTLDLQSGFWQVPMKNSDAEKTSFVTNVGLYQFKVMPFGLCNAPATFQRLMECVLSGLNFEICLLYIDDIIVFSETFDQHIDRLSTVLDKLQSANLKISPKKCSLFQKEVSFLGHIVSADGISTDPEKTKAIESWPEPKSVSELRSFLGTCAYYRRFIKSFSDIAKPLFKLTEKDSVFCWSEECQISFQTLKECLTSTPVLGYPDMNLEFVLDTDASAFCIGGILSQIKDGKEQVIAYFSKSLSRPERNYCVTRRELLAVVESVKHFHHYLYGRYFTIRTDHGALNWLMHFKNPEGQMARWMEVLSVYDFAILHRPGKSHGNADGLSRRPCGECQYLIFAA